MLRAKLQLVQTALTEVEALPDLPPLIRYTDHYTEKQFSIANPSTSDRWLVRLNGHNEFIDLSRFSSDVRELMRRTLAWCLQRYAPATVLMTYGDLVRYAERCGEEAFLAPFDLEPLDLRRYWRSTILPAMIEDGVSSRGFKRYFFFLCEMSLGHLSRGYMDFISSFPGPKQDLYASIRSSETFLSETEELAIVNYLDDLSEQARSGPVPSRVLQHACVLVAVFQHAMRPIQISKVKTSDVLIRLPDDADVSGHIVHVRFHREKQRTEMAKVAQLRKIKREWAILYRQFWTARTADPSLFLEPGAIDRSFFGLTPSSVSLVIRTLLAAILPQPRNATELRHTAAQRMADAGASLEELAELLGQNNTRTATLYFRESATQAERVNRALVTSRIYSAIADVHKTKTIEPNLLHGLSQDHQIAAVPHGVPIAGIGKCDLGQSLCAKNPVLSCYGCRKFLPVRDVQIHESVRSTLRPIVTQFFRASRGETESPAYTQLRRTIAAVGQVIADIGEDTSND